MNDTNSMLGIVKMNRDNQIKGHLGKQEYREVYRQIYCCIDRLYIYKDLYTFHDEEEKKKVEWKKENGQRQRESKQWFPGLTEAVDRCSLLTRFLYLCVRPILDKTAL